MLLTTVNNDCWQQIFDKYFKNWCWYL